MSIKPGQFIKSYIIIQKYVKRLQDNLFLYRQQIRFWNTVKHLWWGFFLRKKLAVENHQLFLQKSSTRDF